MCDVFVIISFFEFGIVWIAIPAFLIYPVARRLLKREWRNLFSWIDAVSCFVTHAIWFYGFTHDFNWRGAGRLTDIFYLGLLHGVLVTIRIPFVWLHSEWRTRMAMISFVMLVAAAVALTWLVNLAECAD